MTTLTVALPDGMFEAVRKGAKVADLTRAQSMDALGAAGVAASRETIGEIRESLAREGARVGSAGS